MNQPASNQSTEMSPRMQWWVRRLWITFAVAMSLLLAGVLWAELVVMAPHRAAKDLERLLESLADRRPPEMTQREWGCAVAWTLNLHGNSLISFQTETSRIRDLERRLAERLSGEVDLGTIHWIWDEYAKICPHGAKYQRFREHMIEDIANKNASWTIDVP